MSRNTEYDRFGSHANDRIRSTLPLLSDGAGSRPALLREQFDGDADDSADRVLHVRQHVARRCLHREINHEQRRE
jgi:hypothetical protein